jgi:uncharacterized protein YqeY
MIGNRRLQLATSQQLVPLENHTVIAMLLRMLRQRNNARVHYEIVHREMQKFFFISG